MSKSILVVDDDESIGKIFEIVFRKAEYHVVYFSSPLEALQWATETTPALVVVDLMMPEMNGVELCQELRSRENTRSIPIILLSALDRTELRNAAQLVGALTYVSKPFAPGKLFSMVTGYLHGKGGEQ